VIRTRATSIDLPPGDHALGLCRREPGADKLDHHDDPQSERRSTRTCRAVVVAQGGHEIVAHLAVDLQRAETVLSEVGMFEREYDIGARHIRVENVGLFRAEVVAASVGDGH
jgi:hypothetical protein